MPKSIRDYGLPNCEVIGAPRVLHAVDQRCPYCGCDGEKMFAFVAEDAGPDDEGILGMRMDNGEWMPFVGADQARIKSLLPFAKIVSKDMNTSFRILEFSVRKDVTEEYAHGNV